MNLDRNALNLNKHQNLTFNQTQWLLYRGEQENVLFTYLIEISI